MSHNRLSFQAGNNSSESPLGFREVYRLVRIFTTTRLTECADNDLS